MGKGKVGLKVGCKKELVKKYGWWIVVGCERKERGVWLGSSLFGLNYRFGGGMGFGKMVEVGGEEWCGKWVIGYKFGYWCEELGGDVIWVDGEECWMNWWGESNGVDGERVRVVNDSGIENVGDGVGELGLYLRCELIENEGIVVVIDWVGGMDCGDKIDWKMRDGKGEMGGRGKGLYK